MLMYGWLSKRTYVIQLSKGHRGDMSLGTVDLLPSTTNPKMSHNQSQLRFVANTIDMSKKE